ncbi:MAG: Fungal specific transcription factor [Caeruleum heppii]|nr:MAG: Fungal specific transcription factor [Caeruleum heppii]
MTTVQTSTYSSSSVYSDTVNAHSDLKGARKPNGTSLANNKASVDDKATELAHCVSALPGRRERPCDACGIRKSKCAFKNGAGFCQQCVTSGHECTSINSPQPRKRHLDSDAATDLHMRKKLAELQAIPSEPMESQNRPMRAITSEETSDSRQLRIISANPTASESTSFAQYIGSTTELETCLLGRGSAHTSSNGLSSQDVVRRVSKHDMFVVLKEQDQAPDATASACQTALNDCAGSVEPVLVDLYFAFAHASYPILQRANFLSDYAESGEGIAPPLLAAVCLLGSKWWYKDPRLSKIAKPDFHPLELLALQTVAVAIHWPDVSVLQAGLLLLQYSEKGSWALTAQLVALSQDLGLHLDCSDWDIPRWDQGLRKRLGWALYMQDKWGSLVHGRPSHIGPSNWTVPSLTWHDFETAETGLDVDDVPSGERCSHSAFMHMNTLTMILSDVLDMLFSSKAIREVDRASGDGTKVILERAKPIQMRLKQWFVGIPSNLRMDYTGSDSPFSKASLHLAYFATEITIHRRIAQSLSLDQADLYLLHICRAAAKTRLISAMDFVNRLKPEHLESSWFFASKVNFALVGTFGSLLWATAPSKEEAEFYKHRLGEYRWTLTVSSERATFMMFAIDTLDASINLVHELEEKPRLAISGVADQDRPQDIVVQPRERQVIEATQGSGDVNMSSPSTGSPSPSAPTRMRSSEQSNLPGDTEG